MTAKARILAAADGSQSLRELAALAGCTEDHARRVVQEAGLTTRPASVKAKVIAMANGRRTAPQIARLIGARPTWVRAIAQRLQLPVPLERAAPGRKETVHG